MTTDIADDPVIVEGDTTHIDVPDQPDAAFAVTDEQSANWVIRRIVAARAYAVHVKAWADGELRRAEREEQFFWMRFGAQLRTWTVDELARMKTKRKSLTLPAGTLGFRSLSAKLVVTNEAAALQWSKRELPEAVKVVETVSKSRLNEHFEETGEIPSGVQVEPGGDKFYVR